MPLALNFTWVENRAFWLGTAFPDFVNSQVRWLIAVTGTLSHLMKTACKLKLIQKVNKRKHTFAI